MLIKSRCTIDIFDMQLFGGIEMHCWLVKSRYANWSSRDTLVVRSRCTVDGLKMPLLS